MNDTLEAPSAPLSITAAALERCMNAYRQGYAGAQAQGKSNFTSHDLAAAAYRRAMPSTETVASIQALIACVAQGINLQIYEGRESTQLLYAAQVALAAHKSPAKQT